MCDVITGNNNIGYEGAKALSQCLTHLPQLTQLDLSGKCVHIDVFVGACVCVCVM